MTKKEERLTYALNQCLEYILKDADTYGTASTAGPMLNLMLHALGRADTADDLVTKVREQRRIEIERHRGIYDRS